MKATNVKCKHGVLAGDECRQCEWPDPLIEKADLRDAVVEAEPDTMDTDGVTLSGDELVSADTWGGSPMYAYGASAVPSGYMLRNVDGEPMWTIAAPAADELPKKLLAAYEAEPGDVKDSSEEAMKENVVEAARAYTNADVQTYDELRIAMNEAVEALERAEKAKP